MDNTAISFEKQVRRTKITGITAKICIYIVLSTMVPHNRIYSLLGCEQLFPKDKTVILTDSFSLALQPVLDNYINAFGRLNIGRAYLNSFIISGTTIIFVMVLAGLAAYAMTRYKFRLRNTLYLLFAGSLLFPAFSTIVPIFKMVYDTNLVSHPLGVIIPQTAGNLSFAIIVLMGL